MRYDHERIVRGVIVAVSVLWLHSERETPDAAGALEKAKKEGKV